MGGHARKPFVEGWMILHDIQRVKGKFGALGKTLPAGQAFIASGGIVLAIHPVALRAAMRGEG